MPTTARTIISLALADLNVIGQGESLSAAQAQDGLVRLNNLVSTWQTEYQTVTAVERTIFPLVANQQTYAIGLGAQFNVPRPSTIAGAGLLMNGLGAAVSCTIARSGYTATVTQVSHPYAVGDEAFITGATEIDYNGLQTVLSVPTANTYTFSVNGLPDTPATGTITAAPISGEPVEIPRQVITDSGYQSIQLKNMDNSLFTVVYYNPTYPFGTITLWPRINTATNQLVLYLQNIFSGFATIDTLYDWPNVPGYAEALQYNLAVRLATPEGRNVPAAIAVMATRTLGLIKRANNKLNDLANDASLISGGDRRYGYNLNTGQ